MQMSSTPNGKCRQLKVGESDIFDLITFGYLNSQDVFVLPSAASNSIQLLYTFRRVRHRRSLTVSTMLSNAVTENVPFNFGS